MRPAPLLSILLLAAGLASQELNEATFARWRDFIAPAPAELGFLQIPWQNELWPALVLADRDDRPVLLWAMNGHPLGCT